MPATCATSSPTSSSWPGRCFRLHAFYNCLAGKVNSTFVTLDQFVNAVMADTVNTSTMQRLEGQCANDLFDWEITEVEVIETN